MISGGMLEKSRRVREEGLFGGRSRSDDQSAERLLENPR